MQYPDLLSNNYLLHHLVMGEHCNNQLMQLGKGIGFASQALSPCARLASDSSQRARFAPSQAFGRKPISLLCDFNRH
jgi:hypothetical protein